MPSAQRQPTESSLTLNVPLETSPLVTEGSCVPVQSQMWGQGCDPTLGGHLLLLLDNVPDNFLPMDHCSGKSSWKPLLEALSSLVVVITVVPTETSISRVLPVGC